MEKKLKRSLLERDFETIEVLKLVKSAALLQAKDLNLETPTDKICQAVIEKRIKNCRESVDLYQNLDQAENVRQQEREIEVLRDLLPTQLGQSDLEKVINEVVVEAGLDLQMSNFKTLLDLAAIKVGLSAGRGQIAKFLKEKIDSEDV